MTDWLKLLSDSDPQKLKGQISLASVVSITVELRAAGERLVGICPFHDDHDASFAIWRADEDGAEYCGCWACDFGPGDVFDFLQRRDDSTFPESLKVVHEYISTGLPAALPIPERTVDTGAVKKAVADAKAPLGPVLELIHRRSLPFTAEWLAGEFHVAVSKDGNIVIPHYTHEMELRAAKWRTAERKPCSYPGSRLDALYGVWRDRGGDVVLCEGESDTWAAAYLLSESEIDVMGLPSGVSANPKTEWIERMRDRKVTLLFDGDEAGRRGCVQWVNALLGIAESVHIAALPDGDDVVSAGEESFRRALSDSWLYQSPENIALTKQAGRYVRWNLQGVAVDMSNFVIEVKRLIMVDEGQSVFMVKIPGREKLQPLTSRELASHNRMREWAANLLLSWKGGARETSELLELLLTESIFAPRVRGTDVVGLHDGVFVLPSSAIGSQGWGYIAPVADVNLEQSIHIQAGEWDTGTIGTLARLHDPAIMSPLLGWTAAAPLRSLCPQFPILGVIGGAGWGKTTLIQSVLRTFGFWTASPMTLTATTPHGVSAYAASTNAFPIWFDEYRLGARADSKLALEQTIRDAWDGSAAVKGGMGEEKMAVRKMFARAPLIITGEDGFSETSHAERMIIVSMSRNGRNVEALGELNRQRVNGLGHAYLVWLLDLIRRDELPVPPAELDRQRQALAVVEWGWSLLRQFTQIHSGYDLGPGDMTRIIQEQKSMAGREPYVEALAEGLGVTDENGRPIVFKEGENDLGVRVQPLLKYIHQKTDIRLPGNSRAMERWFSERWRTETKSTAGYRYLLLAGAWPDING